MLFRIHDDPEHPFSEVVGVLQGIERETSPSGAVLRVVRRSGEIVSVPENDVLRLKFLNGDAVRET